MEEHSFAAHVVAFGRVLRRLGFSIGPAQLMVALEAVERVGVKQKEDVKYALQACLVSGGKNVNCLTSPLNSSGKHRPNSRR